MEPSCDTKAQNLIFAINFATREKKNKTKWTNTNIQSHLNATLIIPLKMIPNKKKNWQSNNTKKVAPVEHTTTTTKINLVPHQG